MNLARDKGLNIAFRPEAAFGSAGTADKSRPFERSWGDDKGSTALVDVTQAAHPRRHRRENNYLGSTALVDAAYTSEVDLQVEGELKSIFDSIRYDDETDYDSVTNVLLRMLQAHGDIVIDALERLMTSTSLPAWKIGEVLARLGGLAHASSYLSRRYMLVKNLLDSRPAVRDGAISGLAALSDATLLPVLVLAYNRETRPELKVSLEKVIRRIQRDKNVSATARQLPATMAR